MTATATREPAHAVVPASGSVLAGTGTLIRFNLRRDRLRIPLWVAGVTILTFYVNAAWEQLYASQQDILDIASTLDSPAMRAMVGVNYAGVDGATYGSLMAQEMLSSTLIAVAIMSILLVTRHTRTEEETGRSELVRAGVVGRHAHLAAALVVAGVANLAIGLVMVVGLGWMAVPTVDWPGSWVYAAAHVPVGMTFAGIAAITVQITQHPRGASGMALAALGAAYMLRAMGDAGTGELSWLSPIGWGQATKAYVENRWWPLLIPVVAMLVLSGVGFYLSTRRDVGSGLRASRPGTPVGSRALTTPIGFALRLHRGLLIGWTVAMLLFGLSYGSVLGDTEQIVGDNQAFQDMIEGIGGSVTTAFASMILTIMAIISSAYVVMAMQRARSEESRGRVEPVLATAVSRTRWLGSHVTVALVGAVVMLLGAGLTYAASGAAAAGDSGLFGDLLLGELTYAPALWVTVGAAVALFGWFPRAQLLTWLVVVYGILVVYMGDLLQLPTWMRNLSPFGHVPQAPADDYQALPLLVLTALAAGLIALGLYGFRRRDLETK